MTNEEKKKLLSIARESIQSVFDKKEGYHRSNPATLGQKNQPGVFVTLKIDGMLRGCIGNLDPQKPPYESVKEIALESAFDDPRFKPLTDKEFKNTIIEISVLTPFTLVKDINEIVIGRDGLMIDAGFTRGLLLPQVAAEYNMTRDEFIEQTCVKAGLDEDAWKHSKVKLYKFSAEVFSENDFQKV